MASRAHVSVPCSPSPACSVDRGHGGPSWEHQAAPGKGMQWGHEPQGTRTAVPPALNSWAALSTPSDTLHVSRSADLEAALTGPGSTRGDIRTEAGGLCQDLAEKLARRRGRPDQTTAQTKA